MNKSNKTVSWFSGGVTSAVASKKAIELFGIDNCRIIMIDTFNEDEDTYRFKIDCEKWFGKEIESISAIPKKYNNIVEVWEKYLSLNVAHGAICSSELKREVRKRWQKENEYDYQVFGFEWTKKEMNRSLSMKLNYPESKPIFPLLMFGLDKKDCIEILEDAGIEIPRTYKYGFHNNNCFKTGCVQGGIGYWQKMKRDFPDKFQFMAGVEHNLTDKKGKPVTMLRDQSKEAKESGNFQVFLTKHPNYPELKCIDDMPKCEVKPLVECNGYCGLNDLNKLNETEMELNFAE